eukprot:1804532-Rhodomonas_salina.3
MPVMIAFCPRVPLTRPLSMDHPSVPVPMLRPWVTYKRAELLMPAVTRHIKDVSDNHFEFSDVVHPAEARALAEKCWNPWPCKVTSIRAAVPAFDCSKAPATTRSKDHISVTVFESNTPVRATLFSGCDPIAILVIKLVSESQIVALTWVLPSLTAAVNMPPKPTPSSVRLVAPVETPLAGRSMLTCIRSLFASVSVPHRSTTVTTTL